MDRQFQPFAKLSAPLICPFCQARTFKVFVQTGEWRCFTCAVQGTIQRLPGGENIVSNDDNVLKNVITPHYG